MKVPCLSIQQPWPEMILTGEKPVENRSRSWKKFQNWQSEGKVLLAIHSGQKTKQLEWSRLTDDEKQKYQSDQFGSILGVVDLVRICRRKDLQPNLKDHKHKYVNRSRTNWCWVLENPRRLVQPIHWKGTTSLPFYVDIPASALLTSYQNVQRKTLASFISAIDSCCLTVTQGNLNNGSLCVTGAIALFPKDVFGESSQCARRTVSIICGDEEVNTDIVRPKNIFRRRTWRRFFEANGVEDGNSIMLEKLNPYSYRVSKG